MPDNDPTRTITVLYFAAASTATNLTEERVPLPRDGETFFLSSLPALLIARHPGTTLGKVLERSRWSVNEEMVDDPESTELKGGEEVAVICPVSVMAPSAAFQTTRLAPNIYMIKEYNDVYAEYPFIYVKIVPSSGTLVLVDTGCGGASKDPDIDIHSLREYIETVKLAENGDEPLNEGGKMQYVVVTTHCHYDHILGIEHFGGSQIFASSHDPAFLSPQVLAEHSLCNALNIPLPSYTPTLVSNQGVIPGSDGVVVIHTPGHTPDELALYDPKEYMLYVGDSLYEHEEIIFPKEGSISDWFISVQTLISLVRSQDGARRVLLNAGHCTVAQPALEVLEAANRFLKDVIEGKEEVRERLVIRGEKNVRYRQKDGRFSLRCPERLLETGQNLGGGVHT